MKRFIAIIVFCILFIRIGAVAESIESVVPDISVWGMSMDEIKSAYTANNEECKVDDEVALRVSDVKVCSYNMTVYYVFGKEMTSSEGTLYFGLSKITYILNTSDLDDESALDSCLQVLIEEVKKTEGEPDSIKKNTNIWKNEKYKIELGKGKLSKYTGSDNVTVALIFKGNFADESVNTDASPTLKPEMDDRFYKTMKRLGLNTEHTCDLSFSLRNDAIRYGMSKEEVIAVEEQCGSTRIDEWNEDEIKEFSTTLIENITTIAFNVTLGDIPDNIIRYCFNDKNQLFSIGYRLNGSYASFEELKDSLTTKYGPSEKKESDFNDICKSVIKIIDESVANNSIALFAHGLLGETKHFYDVNQWQFRCEGDMFVVIDLYQLQSYVDAELTDSTNIIGYSVYSISDLEDIVTTIDNIHNKQAEEKRQEAAESKRRKENRSGDL